MVICVFFLLTIKRYLLQSEGICVMSQGSTWELFIKVSIYNNKNLPVT